MNVLILTPDAVGSTLLQRMLTIYMQFHEFDRPVINLHELTNGLQKYYSPEFNQEIVSKHKLENWGYYQTLEEVVELLSSVDHYKTSRLAHYHLVRRGDSLSQQIPFYNYLNENFYVISCRRANIFEHALSMTLNSVTKKLNVYNTYEKIDAFFDLYQHGIDLDVDVFTSKLLAYKNYIDWSEQYFEISRYFNYEEDVPNIERFILNLPMFSRQRQLITWDKNFGISFNEFNQAHYAMSDIGGINLTQFNKLSFEETMLLENPNTVKKYQQLAPASWPAVYSLEDLKNLPSEIKHDFLTNNVIESQGIVPLLDVSRQDKIRACLPGYHQANDTINQMIDLGIIITGPPIKKQTLQEKQKIIKNFSQCVDIYNQWIINYPELGMPVSSSDIADRGLQEQNFWHATADITPKLSNS
jgi:hypothetical protein